jgi:hypothetical protein
MTTCLTLLLAITASATTAIAEAGPEQCREATANYNEMVIAIHAAVRDYERCVTASLARDDCGAEFIKLQVTRGPPSVATPVA